MNEDSICQGCKYYHQHYVRSGQGKYRVCASGHCVYPRCKLRYGETKACRNYEPKKPLTDPADK